MAGEGVGGDDLFQVWRDRTCEASVYEAEEERRQGAEGLFREGRHKGLEFVAASPRVCAGGACERPGTGRSATKSCQRQSGAPRWG